MSQFKRKIGTFQGIRFGKSVTLAGLLLVGVALLADIPNAHARFARGGRVSVSRGSFGGYGYRGVARTSVRSVRRTPAVARPGVYRPYYRTAAGVARRTTRRVIRRSGYGYGYGYGYGTPVYALPSGCVTVIVSGTTAYQCGGVTYAPDYSSGSVEYYPIY